VSDFLKKSVKLVCHVGNSNIAIGSLPTLQISLVIVALFEKVYYEFRFLRSSQVSWMMYNTVVSITCRRVAARNYADIGIQLLLANNGNRVRAAVLGLSQDWACTDLFENLSVNRLKGDLSNSTTIKPPLSHWSIPLTLPQETLTQCMGNYLCGRGEAYTPD
jgi:hypothetical protein